MLIYEAMDRYITLHLSRQKRANKGISVLRCHLPVLPNKPMDQLTRYDVVEWRNAISATAPTSANKVVGYLRHCYTLMSEWELYKGTNPCERLKKLKRPKRERVVQPYEMPALLKAVNQDASVAAQCAILIALYTGLRKMEVCGLEWTHFDLSTGRGIYPRAKGYKPYKFTLPADVLKRLRTLTRDGPHVFLTRRGRAWTEDTIEKAWYRIRARAGLDDLHFHDLRRTFCAWLEMLGVPTHKISKLMNHTSIQTTEAYLGGIDLSDQDEAIRAALAKTIQGHGAGAPAPPAQPAPASPPTPVSPEASEAETLKPCLDQPSSSAWHYGGPEGSA